MDKDKNKGLADDQDGEFILNESGTSVSIDADIDVDEQEDSTVLEDETTDADDELTEIKDAE